MAYYYKGKNRCKSFNDFGNAFSFLKKDKR